MLMIRPLLFSLLPALPLVVSSCAPSGTPGTGDARRFAFGAFESNVPHAPKLAGYRQLPSRSVAMRDAEIDHPSGKWTVSFDEAEPHPPIRITTASGKTKRLAGAYYPEEGGADAAGTYAFIKGDETILIFQGTSDFTYEETHVKFKGDEFVETRKYAVKGAGMGDGAPGVAPKYRVYPPN